MPDRPPNRRAEVDAEALAAVIAYHERSKHHGPGRYARSLGFLDWDAQPDPFRRFPGADRVALARRETADAPDSPDYRDLFVAGRVPARPLDHDFVARLLMDSLALSAWKQQGRARWSLRVNPSSGNLHPTEGYVLAPAIAGIGERPALYHYAPYLHALERRRELTGALWRELVAALAPARADALLLVGLSSIHWRESWKYGERAYRYCQHDVGHAIAALSLAAAAQGWSTHLLPGPDDDACARLLGVDDQDGPEAEAADCLLLLAPHVEGDARELAAR
ncbi:MAG: SagB/ThcOx family dehydrogenase, partial [Myxococcales bacterium]|nr:SagB/ThcOx family dehydrogenase [Myxococcales bacterium]